MYAQKYTAPFIPKLKGPAELAYEKSKYPEEKIEISTYEEYRNEFDDFWIEEFNFWVFFLMSFHFGWKTADQTNKF